MAPHGPPPAPQVPRAQFARKISPQYTRRRSTPSEHTHQPTSLRAQRDNTAPHPAGRGPSMPQGFERGMVRALPGSCGATKTRRRAQGPKTDTR
jgi:hypothetical protein